MKHLDCRRRLGAAFSLLAALLLAIGWRQARQVPQTDRPMLGLIILAGLITAALAVDVAVRVTREAAERRRLEEALRESKQQWEERIQQHTVALGRTNLALQAETGRIRAITDAAQDAIVVMDPQGVISYWNPAAERILGYTSAEALGHDLHDLLMPLRFSPVSRGISAFRQTGRGSVVAKTLDLEARRKDGREISVQLSISSFQINGGWNAVGIMRDVTVSKQAQLALERQANFARFNPNPVLELSATGEVSYFNQAAEAMARELGWESTAQMPHPKTGAIVRECLASGTPKLRVETQIGSRVISWSFFPIQATHTVHCYGGEITARKQDEESMRFRNAALEEAAFPNKPRHNGDPAPKVQEVLEAPVPPNGGKN